MLLSEQQRVTIDLATYNELLKAQTMLGLIKDIYDRSESWSTEMRVRDLMNWQKVSREEE